MTPFVCSAAYFAPSALISFTEASAALRAASAGPFWLQATSATQQSATAVILRAFFIRILPVDCRFSGRILPANRPKFNGANAGEAAASVFFHLTNPKFTPTLR